MNTSGLYLIGLTGNIACGKSTVVSLLAELGAHTIDADHITHRLQQPGTPVYQRIVATFGHDILTAPEGPINRRALGAIVFCDPEKLQRLEHIVHPAVQREIVIWIESLAQSHSQNQPNASLQQTCSCVAVIDAIKLLESGWKSRCNAIWIVTCLPEQQVQRLIHARGLSESEAWQRIAAQPPQESRIGQADVIIDNSKSLDETRSQVKAAWQQIFAEKVL